MSTIEKIAVYDARIIQEAPKYGVQKGALAISVSPFNALSANSSTMSFQVLVPSLNVFVDRKIDLLTGANVYMEAVPSQYSTVGYAGTSVAAAANSGINSHYEYTSAGASLPNTPFIDPVCPTANASLDLDLSQLPSYTNGQIVPGTTVGPFPALSLGLASFRVTTVTSTTVFVGHFIGGINPSVAAGLTYLTTTNGVGDVTVLHVTNPNGFAPGVIGAGSYTVAQVGTTSRWTFTTTATTTAMNVGDIVTIMNRAAIADVLTIQKVVPFTTHDIVGNLSSDQSYLKCYTTLATTGATPWAVWGGFARGGTAAFPITTDSGYIALPQLESTLEDIKVPQEVITSAGARGFGINSGFRLPKGSFAGCTGQTEDNWFQPIGGPQDVTLSMFPVQSLTTSIVAQVNDCSVNINGDVLKEMILLAQTRASLMQRTTNSKFDVYSWSIDDARNANGATQSYGNAKDSDIGNGSWKVEYINPSTGAALPRFGYYDYNSVRVFIINYKPAFIPYGSALVGKEIATGITIQPSAMATPLPVMFRYYASEPLCVSPFLWQDAKEMTECGIYGCTNIQFQFQFYPAGPQIGYQRITTAVDGKKQYADKLTNTYPSSSGIVRSTGLHALFGKIQLQAPTNSTTTLTGPWISPRVMVTFLTPPPDVTLPLVSTVPYTEFPRYFSPAQLDTSGLNGKWYLNSNTVTLSSIPDYLAIFVKPTVRGVTQNEAYMPIDQVGVTFDNYSNLCSNFTQEDLYACSVAAGLDMDWQQYRGYTTTTIQTGVPASSTSADPTFFDLRNPANATQLTGGPLMLRMGQDIPLSPGLAPGTLGNFSVQLNLRVDNTNGFFNYLTDFNQGSGNNATIIIMAVNAGFFETVRGQSAVRKTILNSVDVEAASTQAGITSTHLKRLVGGNYGTMESNDVGSAMNATNASQGDSSGLGP